MPVGNIIAIYMPFVKPIATQIGKKLLGAFSIYASSTVINGKGGGFVTISLIHSLISVAF